jgi:hypothetical protein
MNMNRRKSKILAALTAPPLAAVGLVVAFTLPASAATSPLEQTGTVHSCTTNGDAIVYTSDGGFTWLFLGQGMGSPEDQIGVVHSYTTGGNANVYTTDGGLDWYYSPGGPLYCSPP